MARCVCLPCTPYTHTNTCAQAFCWDRSPPSPPPQPGTASPAAAEAAAIHRGRRPACHVQPYAAGVSWPAVGDAGDQ